MTECRQVSSLLHSGVSGGICGWQVGAGCGLESASRGLLFPSVWASSQRGGWVQREDSKNGNGSCHFLKASTRNLAQHHFCCAPLLRQTPRLLTCQARRQTLLLNRRRGRGFLAIVTLHVHTARSGFLGKLHVLLYCRFFLPAFPGAQMGDSGWKARAVTGEEAC